MPSPTKTDKPVVVGWPTGGKASAFGSGMLTSWSYSRYGTYKQCPLRAKLLYIDKLDDGPKNPAMQRGNEIHQLAENYVKGIISRLPPELKKFEDLFKRLRAKRKKDEASVVVEDTWAFRKDWTRTTWNDWNGCSLRVKLDVADLTVQKNGPTLLDIYDHKTGKFSPKWGLEDYLEQMELYALSGLLLYGKEYPDIEVRPRLVYLDHSIVFPDYTTPTSPPLATKGMGNDRPPEAKVFKVPDLSGLLKTWEKRVKPMLSDKKFVPKPSSKCQWCAYRKSEGGPCKY